MAANYELEKRKYVLGGAAIVIVLLYMARLFSLQLLSDDFKRNADSNAFLKRIQFPARGAITDRNGRLLVYNQPAYDIMVVMNEQRGIDTLDLCNSLNITPEWYERRMAEIKDRSRNPGYSRFTQQLFMSQLSSEEFSRFQEKLFRFPGFYVQKRSIRQYQ
jgi:penicillin-binding protein 2